MSITEVQPGSVYIGSRYQTDAIGRTKRRKQWKWWWGCGGRWLTMLDTMGKQWDKVPQELDRAGIQAQAQRASTNPERTHSTGTALLLDWFPVPLMCSGMPLRISLCLGPTYYSHPQGELAAFPRVGAAQQMHIFSLSDLHMEWRHLSPSPTLAPTPHVLCELPASPAPCTPSQGCWGLAARGHGCMLRAGTEQRQERLCCSLSSSLFFRRLQGLSRMWQKQSQTRGLFIFAFSAQWSLLPPGILWRGSPQPIGGRRKTARGKKRIITLLKDEVISQVPS